MTTISPADLHEDDDAPPAPGPDDAPADDSTPATAPDDAPADNSAPPDLDTEQRVDDGTPATDLAPEQRDDQSTAATDGEHERLEDDSTRGKVASTPAAEAVARRRPARRPRRSQTATSALLSLLPRRFALGVLAGIAGAGAILGLIGVAGWFITASALAGVGALQLSVVFPSAWVRTLALGRTGLRYGERLWSHEATLDAVARLRTRVFRRTAALSPRAQAGLVGNDPLGRLGREVDQLDALPLRLMLPSAVALAGSVGVLAVVAWRAPTALTPVALLLAAVFTTVAVATRLVRTATRERVERQAAVRQRVVDVLEGWPEIQLDDLVTRARADLDRELDALRATSRSTARATSLATLALGLVCAAVVGLTTAAALAYATGSASDAAGTDAGMLATVADAVLSRTSAEAAAGAVAIAAGVVLVVVGLSELFLPLADAATAAGTTGSAARRVSSVLQAAPDDDRTGTHPWPDDHTLRADHLVLPLPPVTEVTFSSPAGALVVVTGRSGAGKTTLLQTLAGLLPPGAGTVHVGDVALDDLASDARHEHICLIPQEPVVWVGTIADNLRLAAPHANDVELRDALACVDLADHVGQLDDGLATSVGLRGERLSGGQARRLTIARAVLRHPSILLLDEPTSDLDPTTATTMLTRLRAALPDATIVVTAHDPGSSALPHPDIVVSL